ncbi:MAG: PilZ domain-containing protein [Deltaproteobacteria bacterium]|nr:PilZ domain-containing protein [Deltaproteobacteria bacterium]
MVRRSLALHTAPITTPVPVEASVATTGVRPLERRRSTRHAASVALEVSVPYEHRARTHMLRNLGPGGLSYLSTRPIRTGTIVSMRIKDTDPPLLLVGQVTWTEVTEHGYEVGVRFVGADTRYTAQVVAEVARLQAEGHGRRGATTNTATALERKARRVTTVWAARHAATQPGARERH